MNDQISDETDNNQNNDNMNNNKHNDLNHELDTIITTDTKPAFRDVSKKVHIKQTKLTRKLQNDPEYKVTLFFINHILEAIGKSQIDDITLFKDIDKNDLLKKEVFDIIDVAIKPAIELFGKAAIGINKKKKDCDNTALALIKFLTYASGYRFMSVNFARHNNANKGDICGKRMTYYYILG
jgi:hypothetical protein